MTRAAPSTFQLVAGAVYLSPTGRACRLAPDQATVARPGEVYLVYDTTAGRAARGSMADGFCLSRANWPVLRRLT